MTYKELQDQVKELSLPYVGVSRKDLERTIAEATGATPKTTEPEENKAEANKDLPEETELEDDGTRPELDSSVAIVLNDNKQEIRQYSQENHGEDFLDLANQFAQKKNYTVIVR